MEMSEHIQLSRTCKATCEGMEPQKGVVEVYVIDHIEKPSEN